MSCFRPEVAACCALQVGMALIVAMSARSAQPANLNRDTHHHRISKPLNEDVQPSPEIDERVAEEVSNAKQIIDDLNTSNFLNSGYLVSAIC